MKPQEKVCPFCKKPFALDEEATASELLLDMTCDLWAQTQRLINDKENVELAVVEQIRRNVETLIELAKHAWF